MVKNTVVHQGSQKNYIISNESMGDNEHKYTRLMFTTTRRAHGPHIQ